MAINSDKLLNRPSELHRRYGGRLAMQKAQQQKMVSGGPSNVVLTKKSIKNIEGIKVNVIKIENILKGTLAAEKKSLDVKKRQESGKRREKQEEKLETKPQAEKGPIKMPKVPRMGFLDWIKNFIGNVILGYFAVRLVDYLPKIIPIVKFLGSAADFILDVGGKLLDGLVTFVDWGYKAIDFTRGMMKSIGGENFAKVFDGFTGAVGTLVETAIIAATVLATQGDDGVLDIGMDMLKDRLLGKGAQQAAQTGAQAAGQAGGAAAQAGGIGAGAVAGIVAGAGLLSSALGEGAFQVRKVVVKPIQNLEKAYKEDKNPLTKIGRGIALNMVRPLYGVFSTVGFLLDVVGAPFRYAIELLRFPFLSEEDKQKQAYNLAKFDARIREDLRKALNMVTLGLAFKEKGSFGNIYGNKGAQKEMMGKMAGGGITRGGKTQTGASRSISKGKGSKGKYKRLIPRKPGLVEVEAKPGSDVGGEDKILGIFPNPLKAAKKLIDVVNPFGVVKTTGEDLGKTDYFGPILAITSKITLGQKPSQRDYENVGLGINMLISKGIQENQLKGGIIAAFAEGGFVDPDVLSAAETGGDISNWVAKTFKGEIESNAQKTLRMIRDNLEKEKPETSKTSEEYKNKDKESSDPSLRTGLDGATVTGGNADFWTLVAISRMEDSDPQGSADVAQSIYNRVASGIYGGKTIKQIVLRQGQYEPTWKYPKMGTTGVPNPEWHAIKDLKTASIATGISQSDLQKTAAALKNSKYQEEARKFIGGRTDFMGGSNKPGPGDIRRTENAPNNFFGWFVGPAAKAYGAKNPGPAKVPQLGDIVVMGGGAGSQKQEPLGKGYGSAGSKIAGELGRYVKSKLRQGPDFSLVHRHPEHPPYSLSSGHSSGSLHYQGRAVDIGAYTYEQGPILKVISDFNKMKGVRPVQLLHGKNEPSGHSDHVHAAYEEGGETLPYPHLATVSEDGPEIVVDNDSAYSSPQIKNMLLAVNQATGYRGVMEAIRQYAPYDMMSEETVVIPMEQGSDESNGMDSSSHTSMMMVGGGEDPYETLYQGG